MPGEEELRIKAVIPRAHNVKSFRLEPGAGIDFKAGQFLQVTLENNPALKRYLSISSAPTEKGYIEFTKKLTGSEFSNTLDGIKIGDRVKVKYPFGDFILREPFSRIAFICGGIGITPVRSICKYMVDSRLNIDAALVYANHTVNDIVFREDFAAMQEEYPRLKVVHVLSEPAPGFKSYTGYISSQVIKEEIPDYAERKFYLCGPPAMVGAMQKILVEELALSRANIITENFQGY
ncbi:MAG: hypothetical protein FJZ13_03390 [Candidatus Omnitrophica bacterium]|nr:hypothetical protein [Candidatus Omnitrophota bacterium]